MNFEYYYNQIPGEKPWRNNLIYTSLISSDKKTFVQWYHNDSEYHQGQNEVVDPNLMEEKWQREIKYLLLMSNHYPNLIPNILDIDYTQKKIFLEIDGVDFWQKHYDLNCDYNSILNNWQEQMLEIIKAHKSLGIYKYSMHPSSYFIVKNKLKSINYFFTYSSYEKKITINSFLSHISQGRREVLKIQSKNLGIRWDIPTPLKDIQILCFESFSNNYPSDFIKKAKEIYNV